MTTDSLHAIALLVSTSCICAGVWLMAGWGPSLVMFGGLLLSGVIYSRTRGEVSDAQQPD